MNDDIDPFKTLERALSRYFKSMYPHIEKNPQHYRATFDFCFDDEGLIIKTILLEKHHSEFTIKGD